MDLKIIACSAVALLGACTIVTEKPANNTPQPAPAPTAGEPAPTPTSTAAPAPTTTAAPEQKKPPTLRTGPSPAVRDQQAADGAATGTGGAAATDQTATGGAATGQ
jgi:hypothetical protein